MKKFIKALIIVLIVLLAVGGTSVIFFKNLKPKEITTESLVGYMHKTDSLDLEAVNFDSRFNSIIATNENLEDSLFALSTYLLADNISVKDSAIINKLKAVENSVYLASRMIDEYKIKEESSFYDKNLGRNDLYTTMCTYIVDYATAVNMVNSKLNEIGINKRADIKFDMIDMYCRVAIETFSDVVTEEATGYVKVLDEANLNVVNANFCVEKTYITKKPVGNVYTLINSSTNNLFTKYYNACNRDEFAKKLSTNLATISSINEESSNVEVATYYYKLIYGV